MPLIMRPPSTSNDEVVDAERLRQIARRKEQNRNAQRRLRERKEEYTMQLEVQLADLHRRAQSQEEESHFLREALARMRAENQTLAEQIALIHQAVPSTQASHPLPQRASIDLGVDHFAPLNRSRNRSQSVTAPTMPHFAFAHTAAPWAASSSSSQHSIPAMPAPFGATIAPGATHRLPFASAGPAVFPGGVPMPQHDFVEDVAMPRSDDASRTSSLSPVSQRRDSNIISPFDVRAQLSRHGSGQTDLTLPSDGADADDEPSSKIRRISDDGKAFGVSSAASPSPSLASAAIPSRTMASTVAVPAPDEAAAATTGLSADSDDVMASCLESIHSLPRADAAAHGAQKSNFDNAAASWMSTSAHEVSGQLALSDLRNADLSNMSKPLGLTPGALGLTNMMSGSGAVGDGWSISPWIHLAQTPSAGAGAATDMEHSHSRSHTTDGQNLESGMALESRKSLASRRGFSGSLKFEPRAT